MKSHFANLDKFVNLKDGYNIYNTLNTIYQQRQYSQDTSQEDSQEVSQHASGNTIKRILFLDIDGILVTDKESDSKRDSKNYIWSKSDQILPVNKRKSPPINLIFLKRLKQLIVSTNAYVVLSSTWRLEPDAREHLYDSFQKVGLPKNTIRSMTGQLEYRYQEIMQWLQQNIKTGEKFTWCVIDDGPDDLHRLSLLEKGHWVETNIKYGLTESKARKCYNILMGKPKNL